MGGVLGRAEIVGEETRVFLPCTPPQFAEFISKLLGRTQSIESRIRGPFQIDLDDVENLYHLVDQRLSAQNESALINIAISTDFSDGSKVTVNSLDEFKNYGEIRPLRSTGISIEWIWLVQFRKSGVPEKQEISIFTTNLLPYGPHDAIVVTVKHTDRTWGTDISSLLTNSVSSLKREPSRWESTLNKYRNAVGIAIGVLVAIPSIRFALINYGKKMLYESNVIHHVERASRIDAISSIRAKTDYLFWVSTGGAGGLDFGEFVSCAFIVTGCVLIAVVISEYLRYKESSFILLTKLSIAFKEDYERREARKSKLTATGVILTLLLSIIANMFSPAIEKIFGIS